MPDDLHGDRFADLPALADCRAEGGEELFVPLDWEDLARQEAAELEPFFEDPPFRDEFDEIAPLDPARTAAAPDAPPLRQRRLLPAGLITSLCIHLLPLVLLIGWSAPPAEIPPPIPVRLVLEKPKPAPAPGNKRPPPGRLASVSMGQKAAKPGRAATAQKPAAAKPTAAKPAVDKTVVEKPAPAAPAEQRVATVQPPPEKPAPPRPVKAALLKPARPPPQPKKIAALEPLLRRMMPTQQAAPHPGQVPGPAATRDEYLAYLVTLTRRRFYMLPLNFIAGRAGETVLSIRVLADGTIARIAVARGSGYPDIDGRIEKMVASIHRFPPLPQWYQGESMALDMRLRFPQALEQ